MKLQQSIFALHVERNVVELELSLGGLSGRLVELLHHARPFEESDRVAGADLKKVVPVRIAAGNVAYGRHQGHAQYVPVEPDGFLHVVGDHGQMIYSAEFHFVFLSYQPRRFSISPVIAASRLRLKIASLVSAYAMGNVLKLDLIAR